jgi:folate-binding Fe-S cluster repair protein YgfZ
VTSDGALPQSGTILKAGARDIGEITSAYGARGFASVRLDRLEEAGTDAIDAGGIRVTVMKPAWLSA